MGMADTWAASTDTGLFLLSVVKGALRVILDAIRLDGIIPRQAVDYR